MNDTPPMRQIVLGGGCFWCTEAVFKEVRGIVDVESGYANGHLDRPSYDDVCSGETGHNEVVKLTFDDTQISLDEILQIFFLVHDPTTLNRQGNDVGTQYRSGIYTTHSEQLDQARAFVARLNAEQVYPRPVVTEVEPLRAYWVAEDYHQDYFEKHPFQGYCMAVAAPKVAKFRKTFARLAR